jgi:hypothetical protein
LKFYEKYIPLCSIVTTPIGFDIEYNGNELGSYSIRENDFIKYIYATGCAESRLSKIIKLYERNK